MKIVKKKLRNKMSDDFLANKLVIHVQRQIAKTYNVNEIIDNLNIPWLKSVELYFDSNVHYNFWLYGMAIY